MGVANQTMAAHTCRLCRVLHGTHFPDRYGRTQYMTRRKNCGASGLLREVFARYGLPEHVHSDNGRQFSSEVFQNFMKADNIKHTFSAPYHPATNGQAESFLQTFKQAMKAAKGDPGDVKLHFAKFLLAYMNATHATTWECPALLLLGRELGTRLDAVRPDTRKTVERRQAISVEQNRGKGSCKKLSRQPTVDSWHHPREEGDEGICGMEKTQLQNQSF